MVAVVTRPSHQVMFAVKPPCRKWIEGLGRQGVGAANSGWGPCTKKGGSRNGYSMANDPGPQVKAVSEKATVRDSASISRNREGMFRRGDDQPCLYHVPPTYMWL